MTISPWIPDGSGDNNHQLHFNNGGIFYRTGISNSSSWDSWKSIVLTDANGNIGIGTTNPTGRLHSNVIGVFDVTPLIRLGSDDATGRWDVVNAGNPTGRRILMAYAGTNKTITLDPGSDCWLNTGGNVGIGTTSPQNKLDVNGTIHAKEVKVDLTGWSDFVFDPSYKLKTLAEVESYIKTHGHLAGIPSATDVEKNGISLGDMQTKLLQKLEESTLYLIEQAKQIEALKKENEQKEKKYNQLESELQQLKTMIKNNIVKP